MSEIKNQKSEVYVAFQIIPRVRNGNNFEGVDQAIEVVKESGVPYQVSAMETTMRGDLRHLMEVVLAAQQKCLDNGAVEVITNVKIHNRKLETEDTFCIYPDFPKCEGSRI